MVDFDKMSRHAAEPAGDEHSGCERGVENVGPQVSASDLVICDVLDGWPVFGRDQDFTSQPFGNSLLTEGGSIHELGDTFRKSSLAASDLDCTLKRSNVRFLHEHPKYTTNVVHVNDYCRVPGHEMGCTVLLMPAKPQLDDTPAIVGSPDGLTLGDRLKRCMALKTRKLGRRYTQNDLLADTNRALGRPADADPVITQQALSLILNNKRFESAATPAFAAALEVEALWLQFGVGPPSYLEALKAAK